MKAILNLNFIFAIFAATCIARHMFYGISAPEQGSEFCLKALALTGLLGASSVAIALLTGNRKAPPN